MDNLSIYNKRIIKNIPDLSYRVSVMSTEGLGVYITAVSDFFTNKLKNITGIFGSSETRLEELDSSGKSEIVKSFLKVNNKMLHIVSTVPYEEVMDFKVPVTLGLCVNFVELTEKLGYMLNNVDMELMNILKDTDEVVSKMLANEDFRTTTMPIKYTIDLKKYNKNLEDGIDSVIDETSMIDRKRVKDVLPNISSLKIVYTELAKMSNVSTLNNLKKIGDKAKAIAVKTDLLYDHIKKNKDIKFSKAALSDVAYRLESSAEAITNSITIMYLYNQALDMVRTTIETIDAFKR